jgi:hypothetical protein
MSFSDRPTLNVAGCHGLPYYALKFEGKMCIVGLHGFAATADNAERGCLFAGGSTLRIEVHRGEFGLNAKEKLGREVRDRQLPMKVSVNATERAEIETRAQAAGLSVSSYLRAAGLGHPLRSVLDHDAVMALAKVNADQGRLGGLLKLWLSQRPGDGAPETDVRQLLHGIEDLQGALAKVVARL